MRLFCWDHRKETAAIALANGHTQVEASEIAGIGRATLQRWLLVPEFSDEVDRLAHMVGIAARADRLRMAKRIVRQITDQAEKAGTLPTGKDLLDWLKYAQSEMDGATINLGKLLESLEAPTAAPQPAPMLHNDRPDRGRRRSQR